MISDNGCQINLNFRSTRKSAMYKFRNTFKFGIAISKSFNKKEKLGMDAKKRESST